MDRLDRMQLFLRVVDRSSFAAAAADLGLARSTATASIQQLEQELGVRLIDRTTRHVSATPDGTAFYQRCQSILSEVEEAENAFRDAQPRGALHVHAHPVLARTFLLPRLREFLDRYPMLNLQLGEGDRIVDLAREGVDCVIRAGKRDDSGLTMRRLGMISKATCASPAYVEKHGWPTSPVALDGHQMIGFLSSGTARVVPLEFTVEGEPSEISLPFRVTVNNSDTMVELARRGFGIIQAPRYRLEQDLQTGTLIELLADHPPSSTPLSALYPETRHATPRLRVFLNWVAEIFADTRPGAELEEPERMIATSQLKHERPGSATRMKPAEGIFLRKRAER